MCLSGELMAMRWLYTTSSLVQIHGYGFRHSLLRGYNNGLLSTLLLSLLILGRISRGSVGGVTVCAIVVAGRTVDLEGSQ